MPARQVLGTSASPHSRRLRRPARPLRRTPCRRTRTRRRTRSAARREFCSLFYCGNESVLEHGTEVLEVGMFMLMVCKQGLLFQWSFGNLDGSCKISVLQLRLAISACHPVAFGTFAPSLLIRIRPWIASRGSPLCRGRASRSWPSRTPRRSTTAPTRRSSLRPPTRWWRRARVRNPAVLRAPDMVLPYCEVS